jgi:hypothetical protein
MVFINYLISALKWFDVNLVDRHKLGPVRYIVLYYIILHYIILYYIILYYIILYYILLCYVILYNILLCYIGLDKIR